MVDHNEQAEFLTGNATEWMKLVATEARDALAKATEILSQHREN